MDHQLPHISSIEVNNPLTLLKKIRKLAPGTKFCRPRFNCGGIAAKILDRTVKTSGRNFNNRRRRFAMFALPPPALRKVQAASAIVRKRKKNCLPPCYFESAFIFTFT
jgi:hypothetical protein